MSKIGLSALQSIALSHGIRCVGVLSENPLLDCSMQRLELWQQSGGAAGLTYMQRPAEQYTDWQRFLSGSRSIVCFIGEYSKQPVGETPRGYGRVARYAWGKDYHKVFSKILKKVVSEVEDELSTKVNARIFSDSIPLLERQVARQAGFGFYGKNTMLIKPGLGSLFLLAEVVWDLDVEQSSLPILDPGSCGSCTRCQSSCPTGALDKNYYLDSKKCISYLTIEKRGHLNRVERSSLGEWLFGCDICQEVCPFNHKELKAGRTPELEAFTLEKGSGPFLSILEILRIRDDQEYLKRFAGTPLMRAKRSGLLRNACCVTANLGFVEAIADLERNAISYDCEVVRLGALSALFEFTHQWGAFSNRKLRSILQKAKMQEEVPFVIGAIDDMLLECVG